MNTHAYIPYQVWSTLLTVCTQLTCLEMTSCEGLWDGSLASLLEKYPQCLSKMTRYRTTPSSNLLLYNNIQAVYPRQPPGRHLPDREERVPGEEEVPGPGPAGRLLHLVHGGGGRHGPEDLGTSPEGGVTGTVTWCLS